MRVSRKFTKWVLPMAAAAGLVLQTGGPAAAHSPGVMTGWEAPVAPDEIGCGLPVAGFDYDSATFYLRDSVLNTSHSVEVTVGAFVAAPQGVAPGGCGIGLFPIIPGAVTITSAKVDGSACTLMGTANTYQRINTTVDINFNCGGAVWRLLGNQNICTEPLVTGATVNPECIAGNLVYPDPVPGGAPSHFILAYTHS